jgi:hypothetical protein
VVLEKCILLIFRHPRYAYSLWPSGGLLAICIKRKVGPFGRDVTKFCMEPIKFPVLPVCKLKCKEKHFWFTHSLSWALLEKPPIVQLLKNFQAFYGTRRFITVFTRALHWSLSWVRSIQSIPSYPISLRSILIFSTHLRLGPPSGLFPSGFHTNILYAFLFSPIRATSISD